MKVFLGGTVNGSKWRDYIMPNLKVDYFNPVVDDWNDEAWQRELHERETCDFCLYVLTPKMEGYYSVAEVMDDSFKKPDKTIYCYLSEDDGVRFAGEQCAEFERLGKSVQANGAIWKRSLNEVVDFLNSANELANDSLLQNNDQINNCFISYGRRHSLAFARKLYDSLTKQGFTAWFDMNDIPLGVDFQDQIDDGIRKADNFIYIMSPHSINSVFCYKELVLALKYNKRIIPILHVEPQDSATWGKIDPEAGKRNWIYLRQDHDTALALSAKTFGIQDKILDIPEDKWSFSDDFNKAVENLIALMDSHRAYVRTHTVLLDKSLEWSKSARSTQMLLVGKERTEAEYFLERSHSVFKNPDGHQINPPCTPTDLVAEFVMESKKNGNNMQCDIFICHDVDDGETVKKIRSGLNKQGFSTWISSSDIRKGVEYNHAIHNGVVQSSNVLFFITKNSLTSEYCKKEYHYALQYNKRIIPILLEADFQGGVGFEDFEGLKNLQYINFTNLTNEVKVEVKDHSDVKADVEARREKTPFEVSLDEIVSTLKDDLPYYEQHRVFLVQAQRWNEQGQKQAFLLRGFNLDNAQTWLRLNKTREQYPPLKIHEELIITSEAAKGQLGTEVFISYSRKDGDFARKLNTQLQAAGKTTWFDQESISKGVDFEKEIYKGIDSCDNFVFVISPDSIGSEYCEAEVNYAATQNKRIITLLWRSTDPATMPEALRIINWIDFQNTEFSESFAALVQAIELDRDYARAHTLWQQRATEWGANNRSSDFLLNVTACKNAEEWLSESGIDSKKLEEDDSLAAAISEQAKKSPAPTVLQFSYIAASRRAVNAAAALELKRRRRLQVLLFLAGIALLIAIGSAIFGFQQRDKAIGEKIKADSTAIVAEENLFLFQEAEKKRIKDSIANANSQFKLYHDKMIEEKNKGNYEKALSSIESAFIYVPKDSTNWLKEQEQELEKLLAESKEIDKKFAWMMQQGDYAAYNGDSLHRALQYYTQALQLREKDSVAMQKQDRTSIQIEKYVTEYKRRANIFLQCDEKQDAKELLLKAQTLKPADSEVRNLLKYCN